jgi:8-hydroxy-5-deazaflavin:NADPH oxidoreductase
VKIAVIGSGKIGSTAARLFIQADHDVVIANRRDLRASTRSWRSSGRGRVRRSSRMPLARASWRFWRSRSAPTASSPRQRSRTLVVDANNYYPGRDGHVPELDRGETTSAELTARHLADATLVKSFNTTYYRALASAGDAAKPEEVGWRCASRRTTMRQRASSRR